ncbi:MAG: carboxypeptidase-like regulatory domain-containing protein [Tannerella sp.]|jgi:hypothetical protein|nr:carboxypeptidase-like regulatory domain-containing protein [Tannerella sp.]
MEGIIPTAKKLTFGWLKTILLSLAITWAMMFLYDPNQNPFGLAIITGILLTIGVLSLTIYLNLIPTVRRSAWLSALSFFALPAGLPLIYTMTFDEFRSEWGMLLFLIPSFFVTHFYYFLRFRGVNLLFNIKLNTNTNLKITVTRLYILFIFTLLAVIAICCIPTRPWKLSYYQGYVTDMEDNPLAGVTVREDLEIYHETVTDSTGYFRLHRNKDELCPLIVRKDGFLPDTFKTLGYHFEMGPVYNFLRYPGRMALRKDTATVVYNGILMYWKHIEGYWVLTDYFDNIMKYKNIAEYRITPLADNAWAFRISNDSIHTAGLVHWLNLACSKNNNSIVSIESNNITFNLLYDLQSDIIIAQRKDQPNKEYFYRKATGKLKDILINTPFNSKLWDAMTQYYTEELIAGTYENVADESNTLVLEPDGTMSGFGKYNHYDVHTFFGTSHPFDNHNTLVFTDSITNKSKHFKWTLYNNKLTLTFIQILPETEDESYYISTQKFGFIRK